MHRLGDGGKVLDISVALDPETTRGAIWTRDRAVGEACWNQTPWPKLLRALQADHLGL